MTALKKSQWIVCLAGCAIVLAYWFSMHPTGFGRLGYAEDLGVLELARQMMADQLKAHWRPTFFSTRVMAPNGMNIAFHPWGMERDVLGALFFMWNPDFPWLWVYFGISLLIAYFGSGWISRKMGLPAWAAWGLGTIAVVLNAPRHMKAYHHYEHVISHWVYLSIFLDAWVCKTVWEERRWSLSREVWRGFLMLATTGIAGYYWGAMLLEWLIVRVSIGVAAFAWRKTDRPLRIDWKWKKAVLPGTLCAVWIGFDLWWFIPLLHAAKQLGEVWQGMGWTAQPQMLVRPLWLEPMMSAVAEVSRSTAFSMYQWFRSLSLVPLDEPETVVTIGWTYWLPFFLGLIWIRKKKGGPGWKALAPLGIFLALEILYIVCGFPFHLQRFVSRVIPLMKFFRVVSRMGLLMPPTVAAMIALMWAISRGKFEANLKSKRVWVVVWALIFVAEVPILGVPASKMEDIGTPLKDLLTHVRDLPGTTVLDFPFCIAGGNGVCTGQECPQYPYSTMPAFLTSWHNKNVYGIYTSRMTDEQCAPFLQRPYLSWFDAWAKQRCFTDDEWKDLCLYLTIHHEISALLVYPGIWTGAGTPACRAQFEAHFGKPLGEAEAYSRFQRGTPGVNPTAVLWYEPVCK